MCHSFWQKVFNIAGVSFLTLLLDAFFNKI